MRKEELRKLKRINATPKMVRMAKDNNRDMEYKSTYSIWGFKYHSKTVYDMFIRCQSRGRYLMVCIFFPKKVAAGELTPTYEIYCNPEGDEYITRILDHGKEKKWSSAMADNLGQPNDQMHDFIWNYRWYKGTEHRVWQNPEGMEAISKVLGTQRKGIWGLVDWQRKVKAKKIREAEEREQAPWDADMKLIPDILPSFDDWMKKEAPHQHYIFYDYSSKGVTEGFCSHCRKMVPVKKPYHNGIDSCPKCGVDIQYKASGKIQTLRTHEYTGQLIQKFRGGVVIRTFTQRQWFRGADYKAPNSYLNETDRIMFFENGTTKRYYFGLYKNKKYRFIQDKDYVATAKSYSYYGTTAKLYTRNLKSLKQTALKNSAIDLWDTLPTDAARYLAIEKYNPAIEKLAKIGMFRLATDIVDIAYDSKLLDESATELAKILKIDKARLNRLKAINGGVCHLRWYQYEKMADKMWPDAMIKDFGNNDLGTAAFNFLIDKYPVKRILNFVKIWNYLKKQKQISEESMSKLRDTWMDYINMAKKAKMDVNNEMIWKPKDLKAAHDEVVLLLQAGEMEKEAKKLEKKWPKVNGNLPKLKKFEYTDGKFSIIAPQAIIDIVREGRALRHCVHTCDFYFDRIQRDETYLFFLRKAVHEDIPWYTLEVEPNGNIRQKRTTGDNQNKDFDEAVKFLKKWQKVFVKRMTQEEKELGVRADQARLEEYAKLREDGNRVWHGRLAGQLLADVLEADFMAAVM